VKKEVHIYPRLIEKIEDWPIYKLSQDRDQFVDDIVQSSTSTLTAAQKNDLEDLLLKTIYAERIRLKEDPWKVDPPDEASFWNKISKNLIKKSLDKDGDAVNKSNAELLSKIVRRYALEIVGTFQINTFRFAQRFLTMLFNRLFNAAVTRSIMGFWRRKHQLYERINVTGEVEKTRSLFSHGTVVIVPTHFSNLDSILVGYVMDQVLGMPSFSYGAGLNLYNFGPAAYYMNRLGAYRVDRRKKNTVYLHTLKTMSFLSIKRGVNSLFFPGGTRSRSGELETDLKLGLLGTTIEAQRALCQENSDKKVFIVPMVIGYNFVLEAPFLIEQHLRNTGKENYIRLRDEGTTVRGWIMFFWRFFSTVNDITITVGKPMDVVGNFVDENGRSYDRNGQTVEISDYFRDDTGSINIDRQREEEYTKILASRVVDRYHKDNTVLASHFIAFAVFEILVHKHPKLDLYGILRLPPDDYGFSVEEVAFVIEQMQEKLVSLETAGRITLSTEVRGTAVSVIQIGLKSLGTFHKKKVLSLTAENKIVSEDFRTLYYYHNRLEHYDLEKGIDWVE
jgi:glycerol-3-phosphate O-acyltransferase